MITTYKLDHYQANRVIDTALNHSLLPDLMMACHADPAWEEAFLATPVEEQVLYFRYLLRNSKRVCHSRLFVRWAINRVAVVHGVCKLLEDRGL